MMSAGQDEIELVFQACLEKVQSGQETVDSVLSSYPELANGLRPGLEALGWLQGRVQSLDPRVGFVESSRRRLSLRLVEEKAIQKPSLFSRPRWLTLQLALGLILILGLVVGVSGVSMASQSAIPGDVLYPLKIASENTRLALTPGNMGEAHLYIQFAQRRLLEVQALVLRGRYNYIPQIEQEFERQVALATQLLKIAAEAGDPRAIPLATLLRDNLVDQSHMLAGLNGAIPDEVKADYARLNLAVSDGISSADSIIVTLPGTPTSTMTPEANAVVTPEPSLTPTSTPEPTLTSTVTPSPVSTPDFIDNGATASPSIVPFRQGDTPTPTATLTETQKPTRTQKATRTPRPTRIPRPTKER